MVNTTKVLQQVTDYYLTKEKNNVQSVFTVGGLSLIHISVTVMVSVAKANVGKVAETAKANKLKRNEVNCGREEIRRVQA